MEITLNRIKSTKNYAVFCEEIDGEAVLPEGATIYLNSEQLKDQLEMDEVPHTIILEVRAG